MILDRTTIKNLSRSALKVYLTLTEFDLGNGVGMRMKELSEISGVSLRHVRRCLDLLEISDLIEIDPVYWPTGGIAMNHYRLVREDER